MKKYDVLGVLGVLGSWGLKMLGGWTIPLEVFFYLTTIDYLTGLIVAGVFHNSPKTESGRILSSEIFKGLLKKFVYLLIIVAGKKLDILLGLDYIYNGVIFALISGDLVSFAENIGLMGIKLPKPLSNALELLNNKTERNE